MPVPFGGLRVYVFSTLAVMFIAGWLIAFGAFGGDARGSGDTSAVALDAGSSSGPLADPSPNAAEVLVASAAVPVSLSIPSLGVESSVMELGLTEFGELEVPPGAYPAGWFTGGPTPGELGPAVIAGHVIYGPEIGVFYELASMKIADKISIARADGSVVVFEVTAVESYPKAEFPTELVYGNIEFAGLRLITCGGLWDESAGSYLDNVVVYAELVSVETAPV